LQILSRGKLIELKEELFKEEDAAHRAERRNSQRRNIQREEDHRDSEGVGWKILPVNPEAEDRIL